MRANKNNLYTADFETTTDERDCRVWAYAISKIYEPEFFAYGNSIDDFMKWCENQGNSKIYFHNLKFDGEFILNWLFQNGFEYIKDKKEKRDKTFTALISEYGQFYTITVYFRSRGHKVVKTEFCDSLKILNFSVEKIAKDFDLPVQKLTLDYEAYRASGHILTDHEIEYIRHDVEIMSRALTIMFEANLKKLTIGSDALNNYKEMISEDEYNINFPTLSEKIDAFIRSSYKGGFTYLNDKYKDKQTGAGIVFDMNSMYPSKMKYEKLPYGIPLHYNGKYEKDDVYDLYVQYLKCSFELKPGKIPSIQIKKNYSFQDNEYLKSSEGEKVDLVLTSVDLELFLENYNVYDLEYVEGYKFKSKTGMFSEYIDYWTASKIKAKKEKNSSMYRISKLMLNSLYGKFGTNPKGRVKHPYYDEKQVKYEISDERNRKSLYVAVASFITSYARADIIRSSENIRRYSLKKYGFDAYVYSDTDSIHCLLGDEDIEELSKTMKIDEYKLGYWKLESRFSRGKYIRQKCYIEEFDGELNVTIAGLPKRLGKYLNFDNFEVGLTIRGSEVDKPKLRYYHTKGGVVLVPTDFTIK